jgi:hypothetical protein
MIENAVHNALAGGRSRERIVCNDLSLARRELDRLMDQTRRAAELESRLKDMPAGPARDLLARRLVVLGHRLEERDAANTETIRILTGIAQRYGIGLGRGA